MQKSTLQRLILASAIALTVATAAFIWVLFSSTKPGPVALPLALVAGVASASFHAAARLRRGVTANASSAEVQYAGAIGGTAVLFLTLPFWWPRTSPLGSYLAILVISLDVLATLLLIVAARRRPERSNGAV